MEVLTFPQDHVTWSPVQQKSLRLMGSELVFVGYGVVAPEYGWDDYKGVDVRGKTLVMLINDPPIPDPADPTHNTNNLRLWRSRPRNTFDFDKFNSSDF